MDASSSTLHVTQGHAVGSGAVTGCVALLVGWVFGATCNPSLCSSQCRMMGGAVGVVFSEVECPAALELAGDEDEGRWETVDNKITSCVVDSHNLDVHVHVHFACLMSFD